MSNRLPSPSPPSAPAFSVGEPALGGRAASIAPGGRYDLGNLIGQGGMGEVRVAEDRVLGRDVAVKLLSPRLAGSEAAVRRLEREARVTAGLDHPGIVAVHDAGRLADGRPFYAMRLVRGRSLTDAVADATTDADRARLLRHLLAACEAMAFAHRAGVVHRDLKPDNILIGSFGETQVVDWGLARRLTDPADGGLSDPDLADPAEGATRAGTVLGTPWWMSPEQARGERADARSDVWGLGAILHAILSGDPPYGRGEPDAVLAALRRGPSIPLRAGPPELRAIAARSLCWDPAGRYSDAGALAADLERWFDGERVAAYAYTSFDLARRLIAAWRLPLAVGAVGAVVLAAVIALGVVQTRSERDRARVAEAEARTAERAANAAFAEALVARAIGFAREGARADAELAAAEALSRVDSAEARGVLAAFGVSARPLSLGVTPPSACVWGVISDFGGLCGWSGGVQRREGAGAVWSRPLVARDGAIGRAGVLVGTEEGVWRLALDTGLAEGSWPQPGVRWLSVGDRFTIAADYGHAWIVDAVHGRSVERDFCEGGVAAAVAFGDTWAVVCRDGRWIGPDGQRETGLTGVDETAAAAGLPSGELALGSIRGRLSVVDRAGRRRLDAVSPLGQVRAIRLASDGHHVALLDAAGRVGLWDTSTGDWRSMLPDRNARSVGFVGDALEVLSAKGTERWAIPLVTAPNRVSQVEGVGVVQVSPNGRLLAYGGGGGAVTVRDLGDGRVVGRFERVGGVAKAVAFSPDGRRLAITGQIGEALVVEDLSPGLPPWPVVGPMFLSRLTWTDAGLCGPTFGAQIRCWGPERVIFVGARVGDLSAGGPGDAVVGLLGGGEVKDGFEPGRTWARVPNALAVDRRRDRLVVALDEGVDVYDGAGAWVRSLLAPGAALRDVALSPGGERVAAGGIEGRIYVWRIDDGALLGVLAGHTDRVAQIDWDPSGDRLVSGSWDGSVRIWDTRALEAPSGGLIAAVREAWGVAPRD